MALFRHCRENELTEGKESYELNSALEQFAAADGVLFGSLRILRLAKLSPQ